MDRNAKRLTHFNIIGGIENPTEWTKALQRALA